MGFCPALSLKWDVLWIEFLYSFDKIDLCPVQSLKCGGIDWFFRFFWQNGPLPCLIFKMGLNRFEFLYSFDKIGLRPVQFLKRGGIDRVFRFFWQSGPLPCLIFKMGWKSFLFFSTRFAIGLPFLGYTVRKQIYICYNRIKAKTTHAKSWLDRNTLGN